MAVCLFVRCRRLDVLWLGMEAWPEPEVTECRASGQGLSGKKLGSGYDIGLVPKYFESQCMAESARQRAISRRWFTALLIDFQVNCGWLCRVVKLFLYNVKLRDYCRAPKKEWHHRLKKLSQAD